VIAAGLAVMVVLAWAYLWAGAGSGMSAVDMTTLSLFPHRQADVMGEMESAWPVVIAMWWVMMIAMMTPSAAPLVLLYGLVLRRHAAIRQNAYLLSLLLLSGYLVVWLAFSVAAAALQKAALRDDAMVKKRRALGHRTRRCGALSTFDPQARLPGAMPKSSAFSDRALASRPLRQLCPRHSSRRLLRRLLLDADGAAFRRGRHESHMDRHIDAGRTRGKALSSRRNGWQAIGVAADPLGRRNVTCVVQPAPAVRSNA